MNDKIPMFRFEELIKRKGFSKKEFYYRLKKKGYTNSYTSFTKITKYKNQFTNQSIGVIKMFADELGLSLEAFLEEINNN